MKAIVRFYEKIKRSVLFVCMETADIINLCHQHLCGIVSAMIAFDCCVVQNRLWNNAVINYYTHYTAYGIHAILIDI